MIKGPKLTFEADAARLGSNRRTVWLGSGGPCAHVAWRLLLIERSLTAASDGHVTEGSGPTRLDGTHLALTVKRPWRYRDDGSTTKAKAETHRRLMDARTVRDLTRKGRDTDEVEHGWLPGIRIDGEEGGSGVGCAVRWLTTGRAIAAAAA
uniref:Uncharacterized protein n=1 Tax=Cucumis melo TaxID=3656 RepID=A0A9I9D5T6_CUCME